MKFVKRMRRLQANFKRSPKRQLSELTHNQCFNCIIRLKQGHQIENLDHRSESHPRESGWEPSSVPHSRPMDTHLSLTGHRQIPTFSSLKCFTKSWTLKMSGSGCPSSQDRYRCIWGVSPPTCPPQRHPRTAIDCLRVLWHQSTCIEKSQSLASDRVWGERGAHTPLPPCTAVNRTWSKIYSL